MTPKEKAEELVKKFSSFAHDEFGHPKINNYKAKQCAFISVDEILNNYYKNHFQTGKKIDYWKEVKQEIEKL